MASLSRWKIPQTRSGRRSISVTNLLKREAEGLLFKKHGFKLEGETTFQGLDVAIENDKGSVRKGTNDNGTKWETKFKTPYGYLRGTEGADGEPVDCYVGPKRDSVSAFVVHQKKDDGSHDEDTVMLGFDSKADAKADILRHYDDPKYLGTIDAIPMAKLHALVDKGEKLVKISSLVTCGNLVGEEAESMKSKVSRAMESLSEMSRAWDNPDSEDSDESGLNESNDADVFGLSISQIRGSGKVEDVKIASADRAEHLTSIVEAAFIDELQKIAEANDGVLPWVGDVSDFQRFVEGEMQKQALAGGLGGALGGVRQFAQKAIGALRPAASAVAPEVSAMRKGVGFFSTGMGRDLQAGGKMLSHNPQTAGAAAGLAGKDLQSLNAMRPSTAGRRIAGETAQGAGHHISHAGAGVMALNPMGPAMGGAIEGFTRGVGKEMQGAASQGVQRAGAAMVKHAPKAGFGGELIAGGLLHTPGLAANIGHGLAPAAHGAVQHLLGAASQEAYTAAPKFLPRAMGAMGRLGSRVAGVPA